MEYGNPLAPRLVDCSTSTRFSVKRTGRNSASMHSVLPARNVLFLAPFHSPQLRCVLRRRLRPALRLRLRYARHLSKHRRLRMSLRRVTTLPYRVIFIICVHQRVSAVSKTIFIPGFKKEEQEFYETYLCHRT